MMCDICNLTLFNVNPFKHPFAYGIQNILRRARINYTAMRTYYIKDTETVLWNFNSAADGEKRQGEGWGSLTSSAQSLYKPPSLIQVQAKLLVWSHVPPPPDIRSSSTLLIACHRIKVCPPFQPGYRFVKHSAPPPQTTGKGCVSAELNTGGGGKPATETD